MKKRTLIGHMGWLRAVTFTPDGRSVVSGSHDQIVRVWDVLTRKAVFVLEGHSARIHSVAVTADGTWIVSASEDKTLKIWHLEHQSV
jgi:WD40 repeat protein